MTLSPRHEQDTRESTQALGPASRRGGRTRLCPTLRRLGEGGSRQGAEVPPESALPSEERGSAILLWSPRALEIWVGEA